MLPLINRYSRPSSYSYVTAVCSVNEKISLSTSERPNASYPMAGAYALTNKLVQELLPATFTHLSDVIKCYFWHLLVITVALGYSYLLLTLYTGFSASRQMLLLEFPTVSVRLPP